MLKSTRSPATEGKKSDGGARNLALYKLKPSEAKRILGDARRPLGDTLRLLQPLPSTSRSETTIDSTQIGSEGIGSVISCRSASSGGTRTSGPFLSLGKLTRGLSEKGNRMRKQDRKEKENLSTLVQRGTPEELVDFLTSCHISINVTHGIHQETALFLAVKHRRPVQHVKVLFQL